jgi:ribosomal protein S18 acetylase RimI-like enzyme
MSFDSGSHIRDARSTDVDDIVGIEHVSFVHAGERFGARRIRYLIQSPRALVRVAEADKKVLGWIAAFAVTRSPRPWGRIYALAVDPVTRGRRIGPRLLSSMIETLQQLGAGRIFLEVRPDNHAALKLYEKSGFVACRRLENYYGHGHPAVRMVREQA